MNITKAQAKKITGRKPRKVHYCLWNDGTKTGKRNACSFYDVIECSTKEEANYKVDELYTKGRETEYNPECLYTHLQYSYFQREGVFVPTVFTYTNDLKWSYGYFVTRWSLDYHSGTSDIAGKLNCNFYSSIKLDSNEPVETRWLVNEIEKII